MEKEISKLLERYKEEWDRDTQRIELLLRNEDFQNELERIKEKLEGNIFFKIRKIPRKKLKDISEDNILIKFDYPKVKGYAEDEKVVSVKFRHYEQGFDMETLGEHDLYPYLTSARFGQLMIFSKLWFSYNKAKQGDIYEYQREAITWIR